jgi:hypothetical protein
VLGGGAAMGKGSMLCAGRERCGSGVRDADQAEERALVYAWPAVHASVARDISWSPHSLAGQHTHATTPHPHITQPTADTNPGPR